MRGIKQLIKAVYALLGFCFAATALASSTPVFVFENVALDMDGYLQITSQIIVDGEPSRIQTNYLLGDPVRQFRVIGLGEPFTSSQYEKGYRSYKIDVSKQLLALNSASLDQEITVICLNCFSESDPYYPQPSVTIKENLKSKLNKIKANIQKRDEQAMRLDNQMLAESKRLSLENAKQEKINAAEQKKLEAKIAKEGDGSPDDVTCKKYGIKPNTPNYGTCRMQLDMARKQAQAAADQQQRQYEAQQRQYEADLAAQKAAAQKEKDRKVGMALIGIGTGMMTGKSANSAISDMTTPVRPTPPSNTPQTQIITLPNSRPVTCTTINNVTNCM